MLSISPINSLQNNKHNTPNFKGKFTLSGRQALDAFCEYTEFQKGLSNITQKHQVRFIDHSPFSDYFVVTCENSLNKTVFNKLDELAEKLKLKLTADNDDLYKLDPNFDLEKAHIY